MADYAGNILIIGACVMVLFIGVLRRRLEWLLNLVMRSVLGIISIYFINTALAGLGFSLGVGINTVTVLTAGMLGIPGVLALYALGIYRLL